MDNKSIVSLPSRSDRSYTNWATPSYTLNVVTDKGSEVILEKDLKRFEEIKEYKRMSFNNDLERLRIGKQLR